MPFPLYQALVSSWLVIAQFFYIQTYLFILSFKDINLFRYPWPSLPIPVFSLFSYEGHAYRN